MADDKNFYHLMLDLPEDVTSPDHYQLLGLEYFEDDQVVIREASLDANKKLLAWQNSHYHRECDHLMDEVVSAREILRDAQQKAEYDRELRQLLGIDVLPGAAASSDEQIALTHPRLEVDESGESSRGFNKLFLWGLASVVAVVVMIGVAMVVLSRPSSSPKPLTAVIKRAGSDPTSAESVEFDVTFSDYVKNVDFRDLQLNLSGVTADALQRGDVTDASDADLRTFRVTVRNVRGDGTLGLEIARRTDVVDNAGNGLTRTGTKAEAYTIDNTGPSLALTFPEDGESYNGARWPGEITGTPSLGGAELANVKVAIRQESTGNYWNGTNEFNSDTAMLSPATGTTSWRLLFARQSFPADGDYTVEASAVDTVGNVGRTARATFTLDTTPPTVASAKVGTEKEKSEPMVSEPDKPAVLSAKGPLVQYTSPDGILLRRGADAQDWFVVPNRSIVHPDERIASPEPFDAVLKIGDGRIYVRLAGGTAVRLLGPNKIAPFGLEIAQGRVDIRRRVVGQEPPNAEAVLAVSVDGELWRLELLAADVICGMEIVRREPGQFEQEFGRDAYTGSLYVVQGGLRFTDESGREQAITGRAWRSLTPGDRAALANQDGEVPDPPLLAVPEWLDSGSSCSTTTLRRFSGLFEKEFDPEQPMLFSIPAVVGSPRPQISELAAKCLALTARHAALVQTLATAEHDDARQAAILGLRIWLPRSVENRERLKKEMLQHFKADEAQIVYVLLWGYNDEDARNPTVSDQLVNWLTHEHIAIRELAFYHIYRLTGRTYFYRPYDPPMQRQSAIHRWTAHLSQRDGALVR